MGGAEPASLEIGTSFRPARLAMTRRTAYRFLASLFLYPHAERMASWPGLARKLQRQEHIWATFAFFGCWRRLLDHLGAVGNEALERVEGEYVRLFQVNASALPYESYYLDPHQMVGGGISAQVASEYAAEGLAVASSGRELPDYLATELEFMACLCDWEAGAWDERHQSDAVVQMQRQQAFLAGHLCRWLPLWAVGVQRSAAGGLYAQAAETAVAFVRHDQLLLSILRRELNAKG